MPIKQKYATVLVVAGSGLSVELLFGLICWGQLVKWSVVYSFI